MTNPQLWGLLGDRYAATKPRKMLALDGGGIRGVLTLSILKAIEAQVGQPPMRPLSGKWTRPTRNTSSCF
jgi:hypothetical protein